jgi:hypothetical protein
MTWNRVRMLITALLSLGAIASSCTPPSIESTLSGSIRLDPAHPRWTRVVIFTANDAALHEGGRISVGLFFQSRWSEGDHNGPDVDGTLKRLGDLKADARAKFDSRGCTGPDCLGRYRVSFSWLPELKTGSVDISWSVAGIVEFIDVPVVDDAEVSVSFV